MTSRKTILLFRTSFSPTNRFEYKSIFEFAGERGWTVQTVEYMNAAVSRHWHDNPAPRPKVRELLDLWKPDGCIVECGGIPSEPWQDEFGDVPTVYLDRPVSCGDKRFVCVASDSSAIARAAAKELLSLGLDDFVCAKWWEPLPWSEERGQFFASCIKNHGKRCTSLVVPDPERLARSRKAFAAQLKALPRPCGLFAVNDEVAAAIIRTAHEAGIRIPDELAVIGVDNNEEVCENLPVTLTSIEQDYASIGPIATRLLDQMMSSSAEAMSSRTFGVRRVVRRASLAGWRNIDARVAAALEFIRTNATRPIGPKDVFAQMGCSSRQAARLFQAAHRDTVLVEIHRRRLEVAKELLASDAFSIESVSSQCGYASLTDFGRVFKRFEGKTPREWRNAVS